MNCMVVIQMLGFGLCLLMVFKTYSEFTTAKKLIGIVRKQQNLNEEIYSY